MKRLFTALFAMILLLGSISAQDAEGYKFTPVKDIKATSVKNQYKSGTCWSFSGISFLESELIRMGKGEYDLSEAYVIRCAYIEKAKQYVRFGGKINFSGGGAFHDVVDMIKKYGIVPEEAYKGLNYGTDKFIHGELDAVLEAYVKAVVENPNKELSTAWLNGFTGILDAYLGKAPETFTYNGKSYTPQSFAKELNFPYDDYVEVSSFTHHPFYKQFIIELPDNWALGSVYNVTIDDFAEILEYAINNGYTIGWGSDVSEKGFSWKNGVAIVPDTKKEDLTGTERDRWEKLTTAEKNAQLYKFDKPAPELKITQEERQRQFDNQTTTDDHGMQITGMAKDQNGNLYFKVKNSWGLEGSPYEGYFYASKAFVLLKTTDFIINKNGIPSAIRKKLNL